MTSVKRTIFSIFAWGVLFPLVDAQPVIELEEFATGLNQPVNLTHAGDERLFSVGKTGIVQIITAEGQVLPEPFLDITERVFERNPPNEQGLLGLAFHPEFPDSSYFYVNYTFGRDTRISRFTVDPSNPNQADTTSELIILDIAQPFENHNAGDLAFGADGYLYIPMGDGGGANDPRNSGQDSTSLLGKILRIDIDNPSDNRNYSIPVDNPYLTDSIIPDEVWSFGLRNPFRFSFDRQTNDIWIGDVGQNAREELNFLPNGEARGANFGWKCKEGELDRVASSCPPNADSILTPPIFTYVTNGDVGGDGCSIVGGYVYRGSEFPGLQGVYVFSDYCSGKIWTVTPDTASTWDIVDQGVFRRFEIAAFGENAGGELFLTYLNQGIVYKVKDVGPVSLENTFAEGEVSFFPNPFSDKAVLAFSNPERRPYQLTLRDVQGRTVLSLDNLTEETIEIDRKALSPGFYTLELSGDKFFATKIQIQP